jgi:hypothetical protein
LSFEVNEGQTDPSVQFISHGDAYTVFLTRSEAVLALQEPDVADRVLEKMDSRTRKRFESRRFYRLSPRFHRPRKTSVVRIAIDGANPSPNVRGLDSLPGKTNYFIGNRPEKWRTGVSMFGRVKYSDIYSGIDLVYYGKQRRLEFDFVVAPGADPNAIKLRLDSADSVSITKRGGISIGTSGNSFELLRPEIYQFSHGKRVSVQGRFAFMSKERKEIGIEIAQYDKTEPLIIDPALSYSTYLGGSGSDYASGIAVDSEGNAYIAGQTTSTNFPTYNGYPASGDSNGVAFVTELNPTGTAVLYSTYLGGTGGDWGAAVALDPSGNVYVTGSTLSTDFPVANAFQSSLGSANGNAFVARIDTTQTGTASLVYSSYLGGGGNGSNFLGDVGLGIAADESGLAYVTGQTASDATTPFPTTSTGYQTSLTSENGNAFLTVLDTNQGGAGSLLYSTFLGGDSTGFGDYGMSVAVNGSGLACLTGQTTSAAPSPFPTTSNAYQTTLNSTDGNVFVTEIDTTQSGPQSLVYSTYLGGSSTIIVGDLGSAIGLDASGNIYVGGDTTSADFPVTSGAYQTTNSAGGKAFVAEFNPTMPGNQSLVYSTFLGGTDGGEGEVINGLAVDNNGNAFVSGSTSSSDFPTTSGALQTVLKNSSWDAFLSKLNSTGTSLEYSTYFGGSCDNGDLGAGVAIDSIGNPYLDGSTCSTDFSTYPSNAYQTALGGTYNSFVAKFALSPDPGITATSVPAPNASGWNNSAVTVSFTCIPGAAPIQSCTSPVNVSTQGANQVVTGTATDTANNSTSTSVTVNLDTTAPSLSITSPSNGSSVSTPYVTITGSVSDSLSGVGSVWCNSVPATISSGSFSCTVQLSLPSNTITVTATDLAGNATSGTVTVNIGMSAATSIQVTPNPVTVVVGNAQSFTAIDQNGVHRPDAAWSVSDTTIATLATDGSGTITAVAAGTVTVTATVGSASAQSTVTVITALSAGTTLWTAPTVSGFTTQKIIQATPTPNGPDLFTIDTDTSGDVLVRAFTSGGAQLWQNPVTSNLPSGFSFSQAAGDNLGGILIVGSASDTSNYDEPIGVLADIGGPTGTQSWVYQSPDLQTIQSDIAVAPNGSVNFVVPNCTSIVYTAYNTYGAASCLDSINGSTGALQSQIQLPMSQGTQYNIDCVTNYDETSTGAGLFGPPVVAPDGSVKIEVQSSQGSTTWTCPQGQPVLSYAHTQTLSVLSVLPDGSSQLQTIDSYSTSNGTFPFDTPGEVIPDGGGGVLANWYSGLTASPALADAGPQGVIQAGFTTGIPYSNVGTIDAGMVLGDSGTAFTTDGSNVISFNVATMQSNWTHSSQDYVSLVAATSGGGVAIEDSQAGLIQLDPNGNASPPTPGFSNSDPWALGMWPMISNGVLVFKFGPDVLVSDSYSPFGQSNRASGRGPQLATLVHYVPDDLSSSYSAQQFATDIQSRGFLPQGKANHVFRLGADATLKNFLSDLRKPVQAVGFIGHALEDPNTGLSVGICFADQCLEKAGANVTGPPGQPTPMSLQLVSSESAVLFFATCNAGQQFQSLWGITASTKTRALIVPNSVVPVPLLTGKTAWLYAATALAQGSDAGKAKDLANGAVKAVFENVTWRVIGDSTTTIK